MGIIYKLTPEVVSYIIDQKRDNQKISCRSLVAVVKDRFGIVVSKSSINSIFKSANLSQPVGRPRRMRRGSIESAGMGGLLLKAADSLVGGLDLLAEEISAGKSLSREGVRSALDTLLLRPFIDDHLLGRVTASFSVHKAVPAGPSTGEAAQEDVFDPALVSLSPSQIKKFREAVSCRVKIVSIGLPDGAKVYFDGQCHTLRGNAHVPAVFGVPFAYAKREVSGFFMGKTPLVFLMAPGYESPSKEFLGFIKAIATQHGAPVNVDFLTETGEFNYGKFNINNRSNFIFGLWPWQFGQNIDVKLSKETSKIEISHLNKEYYLSEGAVTFSFLEKGDKLGFRVCALRETPAGEPKITLVTNFDFKNVAGVDVASIFFGKWPGLDDSFRDYTRIMEGYASGKDPMGSSEPYPFVNNEDTSKALSGIISEYRLFLDWYLKRWLGGAELSGLTYERMCETVYAAEGTYRLGVRELTAYFSVGVNNEWCGGLEKLCRSLNTSKVVWGGQKNVRFLLQKPLSKEGS
jgi:hypothetical protein